MKTLLLLIPLVQALSETKTQICKKDPEDIGCTKYNILSLTQASQYGYMTARFISYLEKKSYYIAKDKGCKIPERHDNEPRLAMTEIFDMIAGTDTGAIIAGAIAVRKDDKNS